MAVRLYNTLTQRLEDFEPLEPGKAGVYVCGITTYDLPHAGHGRTYTTFDVLVRFLKARGYVVNHVRNVTDVDDKIMKRAAELGEDPLALSLRMSQIADGDLRAIGCADPDHSPRVSTSIDDIIALIEKIIAKENAYVAKTPKGNDVYFSVRSFPPYGKLSHRKIDDLLAGARIEVGEIKRDPLDFALWKGDTTPEALGWESPWGKGRPGWHIECSAMSQRWLGEHFDIHAGGMDLIFPHHENEVAQSESVHGPPMAKYWLHGGFLEIDKEKMSKSLGNFVTIRDVLDRNDAEAFRYYLLGTHYRGPLSFDVEKNEDGRVYFPGIDDAERRVDYLYNTYAALKALAGSEAPAKTKLDDAPEKVLAALDNDLNTPQALAVLADLAKSANDLSKQKNKKAEAAAAAIALERATSPLGLMQSSPDAYLKRTQERRIRVRALDPAAIDAKLADRQAARAAKDFAKADAIRKELLEKGIEVLDSPTGSSWRVNQ
jgi:cysteinyl-tRNA synthetase